MILNRNDDWSMANGRCGRRIVTFGLDAAPRAVDYGLSRRRASARAASRWSRSTR
jgi:hypothetical protein